MKDDSILLIVSGVSNSLQLIEEEFVREKKLLLSYINSSLTLIYFSTLSVFDQSLKDSKYRNHKLEMERLIVQYFNDFIIFRLPIVVGTSENLNTLTNYLYNKIIGKEKIRLFQNACRYLLDISDISYLCSELIQRKKNQNSIINICFNNKISLPQLLEIFEKITNKKALVKLTNGGDCYTPDNTKFINFLKEINYVVPVNYNEELLSKYYSQISTLLK